MRLTQADHEALHWGLREAAYVAKLAIRDEEEVSLGRALYEALGGADL